VAHIAALRLLLQRYADKLPRAEVEAALEPVFAGLRASLEDAPRAPALASAPDVSTVWIAEWPGWAPLQRRLRLLQQDAAQLALSAAAIGEVLGPDAHTARTRKEDACCK
jgi:hypothetical protein